MNQTRRVLWYGVAVLAALFVASTTVAWAQDAVIKGRVVSDRGEPVPGANIFIEELRMNAGTSADGAYMVVVPAARVRGQQVIVRARGIGFKPVSKAITLNAGEQTVDFTLVYDVNLLQTVIVTGVQEATEQAKVPFAVAQVSIAQMPVSAQDPLSQIKGKVAGVNIVSGSGRPGAQPAVVLRGPTSLNGQDRGQDPLYIVDGVIINGNLPDLNPSDIENVEIVKGASGASLYGARAGNGVINITTKSGRRALDGVKFSVRSEAGISDIERDFGLARFHALVMDERNGEFCQAVTGQPQCARTFNYAKEQARINNATGDFALGPVGMPVDPGSSIAGPVLRERFQNTPWPGTSYNAVAQTVHPNALTNNSLDMTGRFGGTTFYASASNLTEGGAIRFLQGFRRNSFRANVDQIIGTNWTVAVRTSYSRSTQDGLNQEGGGQAFFRLTRVPAIVNILQRDTLGRLYVRPNLQGGGSQNENPLQSLENTKREDLTNRFIGGTTVTFTPTNWITLESNFSYDLRRNKAAQINDKGFRTTTSAATTNGGSISRADSSAEAVNMSFNASFRRDFTPELRTHYSLRYLYEDRRNSFQTGRGDILSVQGVTALGNTTTNKTVTSNETRIRQIGLFAGAGLDYKDRYVLDALVRRDGSSLFGSGNRWATFGRVSGAWRMAREPWWPAPQVSELKLRASYGTAGGSPNFTAQYETFSILAGGSLSLATLGNRNLKPELHKEIEVGVDAELLNRYGLTVTYARDRIEQQILLVPVSSSAGYANQWQNAGTLLNKTWELTLNIPLVRRQDLSWTARFVYDRNRSIITQLGAPPYFYGVAAQQGAEQIFQARQGERLGTFYGRKFVTTCGELPAPYSTDCGGSASSFQRNDEGFIVWVGAGNSWRDGVTKNLWETQLPAGVSPWGVSQNWGMPIILRGAADPQDARIVPLGNALPSFRFAITQDVSWRRFTFYALVDAAIGQKVWNEGFHWAHLDFLSHDVDQAGKSVATAKPIGYYYRATNPDNASGIGGLYDLLGPNSFTVEDASYAKLRELMVGYRIGPISGAGDWTVSLVGRNLFTLTGYRGFDPEVGYAGGASGSAAINAVDAFTFPNTRSFTVGVSTSF
jgi:TonB-linked SusC/RagA family outer membrane protein